MSKIGATGCCMLLKQRYCRFLCQALVVEYHHTSLQDHLVVWL